MKECIDEGTLQAFFDNELGPETAASVAAHLASCPACAQTARAVETENLLLANALESEFAESIPTVRLRERVDAAIAEREVKQPVPAPAARGFWESLSALIFPSPQRAFGYASLAAVVILSAIFGVVYLQRGAVTPVAQLESPKPSTNPAPAPAPAPAPSSSPGVTNPDQGGRETKPTKSVARKPQRRTSSSAEFLPGERNYVKTIAALDSTIKSDPPLRPSLRVNYEHNVAVLDHAIEVTREAARKNPNDAQAKKFMYAAYQSKVELLNQVADAGRFNTAR
jgi:hypothetical protein